MILESIKIRRAGIGVLHHAIGQHLGIEAEGGKGRAEFVGYGGDEAATALGKLDGREQGKGGDDKGGENREPHECKCGFGRGPGICEGGGGDGWGNELGGYGGEGLAQGEFIASE